MGRWGPDARGRLEEAALELYTERGYEQTTVAEIAGRAGLTERTFFRHFADKREVLFGGSTLLRELVVGAVERVPEAATPMEAVVAGLAAAGAFFQQNVERSRRRQAVIDANAELQARELSKFAALATAIQGALHRRGVAGPAAGLTAEAGIVVFKTTFERWLGGTGQRDWTPLLRESLNDLRTVVGGGEAQVDPQ
ncbi:TetR/AcrR family transcriptional regulator [Deinococcus aestuarii]|uniref:TetR/AcrR family transcriptional regulator n=1 Tax=Deinococcus aestuarii TaxID=2774531 RepID=UPI001C0D694A|nr:TetR/AcrR family transcriptional regulator [Deinococcus aestuarii]